MDYVSLGRTGIDVSRLGLGCSRLGSTMNALSPDQQRSLLDGAFSAGVSLFDTSNIYGQGESEKMLGSVFGTRRSQVVLMTKAGQRFSRTQKLAVHLKKPLRFLAQRVPAVKAQIKAGRAGPLPKCFVPDYLRRELELSLGRLKTRYVDLFFLHSPEVEHLRDESLPTMLASLKTEGLTRSWGISCDDPVRFSNILAVIRPEVLQISVRSIDQFDNRAALQRFKADGGAVIVREVLASKLDGAQSIGPAGGVRPLWKAVAADKCVDAALCGTSKLDHLLEAASGMSASGAQHFSATS